MNIKKLMTRTFLIAPVLAVLIGVGVLVGCGGDNGEGRESGGETTGQEVSERGGGESVAEHSGGGEGAEGSGGEGGEGGGEEASSANLAPDETFDMVRGGARLIMSYDAPSNSFMGTVENTTNSVLTRVRIEVHLSNGTELGPTTPVDLAPGEMTTVNLSSTQASFTGWIAHAEVGGGEGSGSESGGEAGGEPGGEAGGAEAGEAAMSSPVTPLGQTWEGNLGGLAVFARYDPATQSVQSTVQNTLSQVLCYVQAEPHLKSGTRTVGELGPDVLGHLSPGQIAVSSVSVDSEPSLAGVSFDGYVVHLEVFDCGGTGPVPHTGGEGAEGGGGEGAGGEGHGPGGEGSGSEGGGEGSESGGSEEGSGANQLAPDETFDEGPRRRTAHSELRCSQQLLHGHRGEHDQQRPGKGQDRGAPVERDGARSDDSGGHGAGPDVAGHPAFDTGAVHRMGGPCRGRRWRGRRVGRRVRRRAWLRWWR